MLLKPSLSTEIAIYRDINQKEIFERALETNHIKGRTNDNQRLFIK